ncbi:hypothetical protein HYV86_00290 [Candidatus Woesearchaeota archaeon]|nr:hypothetical protein [Candidatus Woesearchaeota archaeon]
MKNRKQFSFLILVLCIVTVLLFSIDNYIIKADKDYFQQHQEELTSTQTINMPEGVVTNYYYANTPYSTLAKISYLAYLIIPILVLVFLGRRYILSGGKFQHSLLLPISFIFLTFILQSKNIINAVGWEKIFGIMLITGYGIIALILTIIINLYSKNKKREK